MLKKNLIPLWPSYKVYYSFPPQIGWIMEEKSKPYSIFLATQESFFGEINISSLKYNSTWNLKKRHIYYVSEKPGKQISHLFFHPHGLSIREDRYLSCGGWYWGFRITTDSAYLFRCFCYSHGKMNSVDIVFLDVFFVMFLLFWEGGKVS